jgi:hypothetical protein
LQQLLRARAPVLDSLGPGGGGIHSSEEDILIDSLPQRAKPTELFLMELASGEIEWPASGQCGARGEILTSRPR